VHFVEADILHVGDTFWNRNYPFIDYSTGGSIDGQIRAAEANLAKVRDGMLVIPGHGEVGGKADLVLFRDVLAGIREKVATLKAGQIVRRSHRSQARRTNGSRMG
jgi:glyoxylase-like metal-dependent hydrolase (beta-lactamase superfamily II)